MAAARGAGCRGGGEGVWQFTGGEVNLLARCVAHKVRGFFLSFFDAPVFADTVALLSISRHCHRRRRREESLLERLPHLR